MNLRAKLAQAAAKAKSCMDDDDDDDDDGEKPRVRSCRNKKRVKQLDYGSDEDDVEEPDDGDDDWAPGEYAFALFRDR